MTTPTTLATPQIPALRDLNGRRVIAAIAIISAVAVALLVWLLYLKPRSLYTSPLIGALPAVNASLNAISSILLISGYIAVRRRQYARHIRLMLAAVASSGLFLISYITYHSFHGDTKFLGTGAVRPIYFFILITHVVLSAAALPMILTTLYLSLSGRLAAHRRVSRWTFPIWLYVSVTGVLIFLLLKLFNP